MTGKTTKGIGTSFKFKFQISVAVAGKKTNSKKKLITHFAKIYVHKMIHTYTAHTYTRRARIRTNFSVLPFSALSVHSVVAVAVAENEHNQN